jgi:hypothetical protein
MASTKTQAPKTTTICKPQTCPTCGSQECFERPRFFCGQLLTDKDLDAAQRYVIEKNKLHNRYLVGAGVVCGLAVRCDPCEGMVTIEPGYAIDCCGNDIVVCAPQKFDVLDYLRNCFKHEEDGCEGKIKPAHSRCDDMPKEFCLTISYNEIHGRPVTAMVRNNGCSTSRCEPSRTSEVFRFDLIEGADKETASKDDFWSHAGACLADFLKRTRKFQADFTQAAKIQDGQAQHDAFKNVFCNLRNDVRQTYRQGPRVHCAITEHLREIEDSFPWNPEVPQYKTKVYNATFRLYGWLLQLLIDCLCDALLVPCTQCCGEEGVLLACLTVQNNKIEKICNTARHQVLTGPALRYWLQPLYTFAGRLLEHICCELNLADTFDRIFQPETQTVGALTDNRSIDQTGDQHEASAQAIHGAVARGSAAFDLARDYSAAALTNLRTANLFQLTDSQTITAMDIYNLSPEAATAKLKERNISVTQRHAATEAEAYAFSNLLQMTWVLTPQSKVELVISPDNRVTSGQTH